MPHSDVATTEPGVTRPLRSGSPEPLGPGLREVSPSGRLRRQPQARERDEPHPPQGRRPGENGRLGSEHEGLPAPDHHREGQQLGRDRQGRPSVGMKKVRRVFTSAAARQPLPSPGALHKDAFELNPPGSGVSPARCSPSRFACLQSMDPPLPAVCCPESPPRVT
jgi:hypothetical protein